MSISEHDDQAIKRAKALISEAERLAPGSINVSNTAAKLIGQDYLALHERLRGAVDAMHVAKATMERRMRSDEALFAPFDEDMADAIRALDRALAGGQ